jgi:hypothetical protein
MNFKRLSRLLNQQQYKEKLNDQNLYRDCHYLLEDGVRHEGSAHFPFLNLGMVYIPIGRKEEHWIKLFKNKPVIRQTKDKWISFASNCMAI